MNLETQNILAKLIQKKIPITQYPFAEIGKEIQHSEEEVISQLKKWKEEEILREISAVVEGSYLNYDSALVCGKVPPSQLEKTAQIIANHPTVTHLYERNHDYNLWFTIAVPFSVGLEKHLDLLEKETGIEKYFPLRRTNTFKIGVSFDLQTKENSTDKLELNLESQSISVDEKTRKMILSIQKDLPLEKEPFAACAARADVTQEELIEFINANFSKTIRKFVATFNHRNLGVKYNAMTVWKVPESQLEEKGQLLAGAKEVSHCYARGILEDFPYNLYSMLHGPDEETVKAIIERLSNEIGIAEYKILHSPKEFKKCRLRYLLPELDEWFEKRN